MLIIGITCLMVVILASSTISTMANVEIVMQHNDIEIFNDDTKYFFADEEGNRIESYTYNDRTYVPIRAFTEFINKELTWDEEKNLITIRDKPLHEFEGLTLGDDYRLYDELEHVSLIELIVTPEEYNEKIVCIEGVLSVEFENDALYLTRDDYTYMNKKNAISLNFRTDNQLGVSMAELEQLDGCYVRIEGKFNSEYALLTDINLLHCCES